MDIANFNTVVVFKWEGDSLVSFVGSQEDDASQHPFPSTVYALYTPNGEGNSSMQNTNISGAKHEEGTSIHIEGFKPLFHLQRSHEVSDPIRAYLNISCSTTVENAPLRQRGILMRVRRGNMSTLVDPVLCMKAFLQFLQQRTVDKTGVDLSQDVEIFITASCPIDVPLAATDELKRLITEVWQSGPKQQAKVSVQVTREPFSGALYVQDWVFCGKGSKLDHRSLTRILKSQNTVLFQILDIGHITAQWCLLEVWWEQTTNNSIREGSSVVTEENSHSVPVQKSRIVWSKCENVGSYLTTTLFKEKVKALLTGRRSLVPDTNVDSIPMTEFNTLKELATRSIVLGETSLDLSKRGNSMPELQKKALQARRPEKDDHSMSIPVSELTKWFEESNTHLVNFLKRNGKDRDEVIRRYFDPTKKGDDRLRVINSPIGGGHKAYGVRDIAERFLSGSITEWDHHPLLHDEQHFKLSQVAAGNILYCESEGRATCPSLTRRLDFNLGFIFLDENNNEHVFYIINKDVVDTLPRSVEYEIENLVTHEVTPVADGEATFAQINQGFRFKTKIQWVMDRSFLPVGTTTRPLKGIKPRPITYEGSALTDTHQNGQEIKKIKVIVDIFQWQVSVQVSKKRGRGNVASSSQFGRPVVEDSESLDPPNKKEPAAGRKKAAPQKAHS